MGSGASRRTVLPFTTAWTWLHNFLYVEGQNAFRLRGKSATLAGRPDLVVLADRDATIIDVKTGREQPWHRVHVMIYQYRPAPLALPQYRGVRIGGEAGSTSTARPSTSTPNSTTCSLGTTRVRPSR